MELPVNLEHHSYKISIKTNSLSQIGNWLANLWHKRKLAIITDDTVNALYGSIVKTSLIEAGFETELFSVTPGEASKSLTTASLLYEQLAEFGMTRSDGVVILGGGVVGDLGGFVASTYMRGLSFVQVPTTLLAQVDSSVGGKTAVNTEVAKNLVGTFAQPDGVLIDPQTLQTLNSRQISEGIAEIVKSAAIADMSLWSKLEQLDNKEALVSEAEVIVHACCQIKARVVEEDEFDNGNRLILNFGHTIGHAIENQAGYGEITHGEAVSIGMVQLSKVAEKKGLIASGVTASLREMLTKFDLPIEWPDLNREQLYGALTHDKKTRGSQLKLILVPTIGQAVIHQLPITEMKEFLEITK
ncbi:3-dehydroquinate synthase [Vagococcus xieshaowenii]|uniref:3-dehydroquinate synthase n=1 Tax=Vagococcus xieshaowenii TaxID=2562451 RepID=A0AAJ5EGZ9_9ENTE|nr:3-dehydroquinate synthase [Vagococcus xieshaowenii]QCA28467.1 3-dehydroquinate synthase [Vagococcus xieshaowenii]TFZ42778.1 3-dehydroquinate synthase [Vagococcus xieshaowenii]